MARQDKGQTIRWGNSGERQANIDGRAAFSAWTSLSQMATEANANPERALAWFNMCKMDKALQSGKAKAATFDSVATLKAVEGAALEAISNYKPFERAVRAGAPVRATAFSLMEEVIAENPGISAAEAHKIALQRARSLAKEKETVAA
jgi:hypothetical protein